MITAIKINIKIRIEIALRDNVGHYWIMAIIEFTRPLVLASASPARRELLNDTGLKFETQVVTVDESVRAGDEVGAYCERLARAKAVAANPPSNDTVIIAVDTAIGLGGAVIGKPADKRHAREILKQLSGRSHEVASGIAVRDVLKGTIATSVVRTEVVFSPLTDAMIDWYLSTGEWHERAGAYAIQGKGSALIASVNGCFTNVIGLSIPTLLKMLVS
jgi:septum formation protein